MLKLINGEEEGGKPVYKQLPLAAYFILFGFHTSE